MLVLIADLSASQAEIVVIAKLEDVGEEVVALDDEVLDDGINHRVRSFNAGNRNIASVLENTRDDYIGEILDEMQLERGFAILVGAEILEQLLDSQAEGLVLWILVELITKELEFVQNAVGVVAIAIAEEELSLVVQTIPLVCRFVLENVSLLL